MEIRLATLILRGERTTVQATLQIVPPCGWNLKRPLLESHEVTSIVLLGKS